LAKSRRHRSTLLVFLAIALAHVTIFYVAEVDSTRGDFDFADYAGSATPIELQAMPQRPKTASRPPHRPNLPRPRAPAHLAIRPMSNISEARAEAPDADIVTPGGGENRGPSTGDLATADALPDFGAAPTLTAPSDQYPIQPGEWDVAERWLVMSRTEKYCLKPENILRFMVAPCNHIYHCSYSRQEVSDGKLRFVGVVRGNDQLFNVQGSGIYSPTELRVNVTGLGHWHILPVAFGASLDGHFVSAQCSAAAKPIRQR